MTDKSKFRILNLGFAFLICVFYFWFFIFGFNAQAWRLTKDLEQEIREKQAAVKFNSQNAYAHFDLAITYAYTNQIEEGWKELRKAEELDPQFRHAGLSYYVKKVTESPADGKLRFRLAFAYFFNQRKKEAIGELENVLILDPYNPWAYGYISLIYGEIGEIDKAMDWARRGIKVDSNVAVLHLLLSEGYYKKGDAWNGFLERLEAFRLRALGY